MGQELQQHYSFFETLQKHRRKRKRHASQCEITKSSIIQSMEKNGKIFEPQHWQVDDFTVSNLS
jgi:hypothetical protein